MLDITSDLSATGSVPSSGGGLADIAFLVRTGSPPVGGPNAFVQLVEATFWIERVHSDHQHGDFNQLQYSQRVLLNFNGLSWRHITVATLTEGPS